MLAEKNQSTDGETQPRKSLLTLSLMAMAILPATVVFTVTGDAPQTLVLTLLGLAASMATRKPLERTTRSFVYTGLAAVVAAVISDQALPVKPERFFLMPAELYGPMVIYLAVALTFFDQRESNVSAIIGLSLVAMMMAGNVLGFRVPHERLPISQSSEQYIEEFYAGAVAVQLAACLTLLPRAPWRVKHRSPGPRRRPLRAAVLLVLIACAAGGALGIFSVAHAYESAWQRGFMRLIQRYMYRSDRRVAFGREVDLWRTVRPRMEENKTVILRVISDKAPGYMRGRVYTRYRGGVWAGTARSSGLHQELPGGRLAYSIYRRDTPPGTKLSDSGVEKMDVLPSNTFRSEVLLAPGHASEFQLIAETVAHSRDGELTPNEWEQQIGYTMTVPAHTGMDAYPGPELVAERAENYLRVPADLQVDLLPVIRDVFGPHPFALSTQEAVAAVTAYFGTNFTYELGVAFRRPQEAGDPVIQFLRDQQKGHCELFGTSAVLLLRSVGVPARYVTGIVCEEQVGLSYWVARLMDLHAWCEVYDASQQRWILVETTPGSGIPQGRERFDHGTSLVDRIKFNWQHIMALMKRGTVASAIVAAVTAVVELLGWLLLNPVGGPIFVGIGAAVLYHWWHRRIERRLDGQNLPAQHIRLQTLYLKMVKALRRQIPDLPARPTAAQVMDAVSTLAPNQTDRWRESLGLYQELRFGDDNPAQDSIATVARGFKRGLKGLGDGEQGRGRADPGH